jgi:pimeloyl-ACP methyl ester carboxylesterase
VKRLTDILKENARSFWSIEKMVNIRYRYILLLLSLTMIVTGALIQFLIQTNFGLATTSEIDFRTADQVSIHATLQVPKIASETNPLPGVVVIHGVYQSKEWLRAFGVELVRRGFVTLSIDAASHGNSDYVSYDSDRGGAAAIEYLDSLSYVSNIGIVGHSMGAGIATQALALSSVVVDAMVFVGWGSKNLNEWANNTYPNNFLITVGRYDELFNIPTLLTTLAPIFGESSEISPNQLYGSFNDNSARKLVIGETNHLLETIDPEIIGETVEWLKFSLQKEENNSNWIPKNKLIYPLHILAGLISSLGIIISILPLLVILTDVNFFSEIKGKVTTDHALPNRSYWLIGIFYALISLLTLFPTLFLPQIPFPQNMGATLGYWLLGTAVIASICLYLIIKRQRNDVTSVSRSDLGIDYCYFCGTKKLLKSAILASFIFIWLYTCTIVLDVFIALDFSFFLPLFNDLTFKRFFAFILYLFFTIPFFLVEMIWIMGFLKPKPKNTEIKTQISHAVKSVVIKSGLYLFIILAQLILSILSGSAFISGMFGFYLLFFWLFLPLFTITTIIGSWAYYLTDRVYLGAFISAILLAWNLASIMTLIM